ncbi:TraR/DksA C4-type zinc finger protein [Cellulomonas sp. zg-ZUI222]|uniref:TraR/DksA C4-type zinc finger protein n=1 Tax=Cellulomonas wangleii TaxID=2816956 RepID=A0ABX8D7D7_9CELL|nr:MULTISPECIES: TraR/DksA C4-type zinc finger protein [Cellulomonas]MBO0901216.1 TraR/DksA C4-type zinc finger protein [Cellulomonas sp. zg-ZUI22]MBO0922473.1 TraR/DksA C4-type zinc finger protein [Cellulomonas wangleii]MBO0924914.1 TraR/DksA C4-type zinc finger protein [Cellulomonas wangleii]QVI63076.1 TraR/DksA C4-type zinc finger protein [Cellulomonas wangleii]
MDHDRARALLLELRRDAVARLSGLGDAHQDVVDAARGANVDDEHDPEGATIAFERAQLEALADGAHRRLAEVDAALGRLADGTYGTCAVGGEPIDDARLEARPTATTCVAHT